MADTLSLKCNKCGVTHPFVETIYTTLNPKGCIQVVSKREETDTFITVHRNGCYQAEVEAGNPPPLADIFTIKEAV